MPHRIHNENVTCENPDCKNFKIVIGRRWGITCPICGDMGLQHSHKCRALKGGKVRCICWIGHQADIYYICDCVLCRKRRYRHMDRLRYFLKVKKRIQN